MRQKGFTLIELVIVIILMSLLLVGGIYILSQVFSAAYTARNLSDANWQGRLAYERMLRDLRATHFPTSLTIGGTNGTLTFTDTDNVTVQYALSGTNLMRKEPSTASPGDVIATGVSLLNFYPYDITGTQQGSPSSSTVFIQIQMTVTQGGTNLALQSVIYPFNFGT